MLDELLRRAGSAPVVNVRLRLFLLVLALVLSYLRVLDLADLADLADPKRVLLHIASHPRRKPLDV